MRHFGAITLHSFQSSMMMVNNNKVISNSANQMIGKVRLAEFHNEIALRSNILLSD